MKLMDDNLTALAQLLTLAPMPPNQALPGVRSTFGSYTGAALSLSGREAQDCSETELLLAILYTVDLERLCRMMSKSSTSYDLPQFVTLRSMIDQIISRCEEFYGSVKDEVARKCNELGLPKETVERMTTLIDARLSYSKIDGIGE